MPITDNNLAPFNTTLCDSFMGRHGVPAPKWLGSKKAATAKVAPRHAPRFVARSAKAAPAPKSKR